MKTVTKKEVSKRVANYLNEKIYTTERFVDAVFTVIREVLSEANPEIRIEIRDFGVFEVCIRKARIGRNPNRPEMVVSIPERKVVKYKPGKPTAIKNGT